MSFLALPVDYFDKNYIPKFQQNSAEPGQLKTSFMLVRLLVLGCWCASTLEAAYFSRPYATEEIKETRPESSNLGCFLCTQLLSVTKHRVGLSQNQLRNAFYEKCRLLPAVFKEQCFTFVETSLPEIYFALNYDFSTKDICLRLNLCEEGNPFAVGGPPPEEIEMATTEADLQETLVTTIETTTEYSTPPAIPTTTTPARVPSSRRDPADRIGNQIREVEVEQSEDNRLTCAFCERMLENAKTYAVTSKADITVFANSACAQLAKGPAADTCFQLADKRIAELAKFVDQQVVEALWCAELNQC